MPTLSLKKIFIAIIGIVILAHLKEILYAFGSVYLWFSKGLGAINDFSEGAQAAISVAAIGVIIVVTLRVFKQ